MYSVAERELMFRNLGFEWTDIPAQTTVRVDTQFPRLPLLTILYTARALARQL